MPLLRLTEEVVVVGRFVDGLELSWEPVQSGRYGNESADELEATLDALRRIAKERRRPVQVRPPAATDRGPWKDDQTPWTFGGSPVNVEPTGLRDKPYQLTCEGWVAGVAFDGRPGPRAFFQLRSDYLHDVGAVEAARAVERWVEAHLEPLVGRKVEDAPPSTWRVSRLDLAVDVAGIELEAGDTELFTTRATNRRAIEEAAPYTDQAVADHTYRRLTSLRFGTRGRPLFARIYSKTTEAAADDPIRRRWAKNGYRPALHGNEVWRVEFEFRSALFRELVIDGKRLPRDPGPLLEEHLSNLWSYATTKWLLLRDREKRHTRIERTPVAPWWVALGSVAGFEAAPTIATQVGREPAPPADGVRLLAVAVGALASFAAAHGLSEWSDTCDALDRHVRETLGEATWKKKVASRSGARAA